MAYLWTICFLFFGIGQFHLPFQGPEICDNGQDDDGDGLIDLNDSDCVCNGIRDTFFVPSGLIPNPSFEDYTECPDTTAQLYKCKNWIQASAATSDYFNLCDFWQDVVRGTPPLPLPADKGYVGFLDIENLGFGPYKEYVGACLSEPMVPGKEYTLSFWVGFGRRGTQQFGTGYIGPRRSFNMAVFGTSDCSNLPFGIGSPNPYLCPTAYQGWFELSRLSVTGSNKWIRTTVKLRPNVLVESIVLGPACAPTDGNYFYWLDELILEETSRIDSFYFNIEGFPCSDTIALKGLRTNIPTIKYQWYKDGIAIPGANTRDYYIPKGAEGVYVLRAANGSDCELSSAYDYKLDHSYTFIDSVICEGQSIDFGGVAIDKAGQYTWVTQKQNGCDSTIYLFLEIMKSSLNYIDTTICQHESLTIGDSVLTQEGSYLISLSSSSGCDSIVQVNLRKVDHFYLNVDTSICEGSFLSVGDTVLSAEGTHRWQHDNNRLCDSFFEVKLKVYPESFLVDSIGICEGDTLEIDNKSFFRSGIYDHSGISINGCDSFYRLVLTVNPKEISLLDTSICEGSFLDINGSRFDREGRYTVLLDSWLGCDSIVVLDLGLLPAKVFRLDTQICQGDNLVFGGRTFNASGHFEWKLSGQFPCEDSYILDLKVSDQIRQIIDTAICEGTFLLFRGEKYEMPGKYLIDLPSSGSCDSIIELNIEKKVAHHFVMDTTLCSGNKLSLGNLVLDSSGQYFYLLKNFAGCDSSVLINLSYYPTVELHYYKKDPVCFNQANGEINLIPSGGVGPYRYNWLDGDTAHIRSNLDKGIYQVTVTDLAGCTSETSFEIIAPECFCFDIKSEDFYCSDLGKGKLNIKRVSGGKDPVRYFLNDKEVSNLVPDIQGLDSGVYNLVIRDSLGCEASYDFTVTKLNSASENLGFDTVEVFIGDSVWLSFGGEGFDASGFVIEWDGTRPLGCSDCAKTGVKATSEISEYRAYGKDANGCEFEYRAVILARKGFWAPNAFTPNSDGINDYFNLFTDPGIALIDLLQIYDRWGGLLFESKGGEPNSSKGAWFGESGGKMVNPGVYTYLFLFRDRSGKSYRLAGDVNVIR